MPDLPKCLVTGYARNHDGSLMAGGVIRVHKVSMPGAAIESASNSIFESEPSGEDGKMEVELPQGASAYLSGPFVINGVDFNVDRNRTGRAVTIPDAATADLEDLPTPSQVPSQGLTIKSDGEALGLVGTLNFSTSLTVERDGVQANIGLAPATADLLGGVRVGTGLSIDGDGILSASVVDQETVQDYLASFFNSQTPALSATYNDAQNRVDLSVAEASGLQAGLMPAADFSKLAGIEAGATANSTDAQLRARSTHTGSQAISTITNLSTQLAQLASDISAEAGARANADALHAASVGNHDDVSLTSPQSGDFLRFNGTDWVNSPLSASDIPAIAISGVTGLQGALDGKQGLHANLTALAGLTLAADKLPYATGAGALALTDLSLFGRSLIDDANAAAGRTTLELGSGNSPTFTGLTLSGLTAGRVPLVSTGGLLADDSALRFDATNDWLTVGTGTAGARLTVTGSGAYNSAGAARFGLLNTAHGTAWNQIVDDAGNWSLNNGFTTKMDADPGANGIINLYHGTGAFNVNGTGTVTIASTNTNFTGTGNTIISSRLAVGGITPPDVRYMLSTRNNTSGEFNAHLFKTFNDSADGNFDGAVNVKHDKLYAATPGYADTYQVYSLGGSAGTILGNNNFVGATLPYAPTSAAVPNGYIRFELGPLWPYSEKMRLNNQGDLIVGWTLVRKHVASQSGTTVTASSGSFAASDVGKWFAWGDYETGGTQSVADRITAYTDSSHVTVETTRTISGQAGRVVAAKALIDSSGNVTSPSLSGGTEAGANLTLNSTSHATKGNVLIATGGGSVGIGATSPLELLHVKTPSGVSGGIRVEGTGAVTARTAYYANGVHIGDVNADGTNGLYVWSFGTKNFKVYTTDAGVERLTVDTTGLVGVNKSSSIGAQLHVVAGAAGVIAGIFDTAATPSAKILDLRINGTTTTWFDSAGKLNLPQGAANAPSLAFTSAGLFQAANTTLSVSSNGSEVVRFNVNGMRLGTGLLTGGASLSADDVSLGRNAAGVWQFGDGGANANGKLNCAEYRVAGTKVLGAQGAAIADADGTLADVTTKFNTLLARISLARGGTHNLIA